MIRISETPRPTELMMEQAIHQTNLMEIHRTIRTRRLQLDARIADARSLAKRGTALENQIEALNDQILDFDKAVLLLNTIAEERQEPAHRQIESLITSGLQTMFGQVYTFHLVKTMSDKGRRPEVNFVVRSTLSGGKIVDTPILGSRGGGLAEVVGVLLRIVLLLLAHKDKDTPLVLDEPFARLSDKYLPPFAEFLKELVSKTRVQIVLVTHQREFGAYADKIYDFASVDGVTRVKEVSHTDV